MVDRLNVWLYGTHTAVLTPVDGGRSVAMTYTGEALARWGLGATVLSMSLPVSRRPTAPGVTTAFFRGLLPEGRQLTAMAQQIDVAESNTFDLLAEYGKDVAGALYITAGDEPEPTPPCDYVPITENALAELVAASRLDQAAAAFQPLGNSPQRHGRSLDGHQGKRLVARFDGIWYDPGIGSPSTHIAKPRSTHVDHPDLTENEAVTMRWARQVGLTDTATELLTVAGEPILVQSRYDRITDAPFHVRRVHQEDGCQATGFTPDRKYQTHGGPSLAEVARLLAPGYRRVLLAHTTFRLVVGDTDAHAKNISLLHSPDGTVSLAPLYDCQPGLHYVANSLAQTVNGVETFPLLTAADIVSEGRSWGLTARDAAQTVTGTVATMVETFGELDLTPANPEAFALVERRLARFAAETGAR